MRNQSTEDVASYLLGSALNLVGILTGLCEPEAGDPESAAVIAPGAPLSERHTDGTDVHCKIKQSGLSDTTAVLA